MAEAIILEFAGVGRSQYDQANRELGIDMATGTGDWPSGLLMHAAGTADDGGFVVTEVWSSREAQGIFMQARLAGALEVAGITAPPKVTWVSLLAYHRPAS